MPMSLPRPAAHDWRKVGNSMQTISAGSITSLLVALDVIARIDLGSPGALSKFVRQIHKAFGQVVA